MKFLTLFPHRRDFRSTDLAENKKFCLEIITNARDKALGVYERKYDQERYANLALFAHEQGAYICIKGVADKLIAEIEKTCTLAELKKYVDGIVTGGYLEGMTFKIPNHFVQTLQGKLDKYYLTSQVKVDPAQELICK